MNKTLYLAGPISGLSYESATDWRLNIQDKLPFWVKTLSPLRAKTYLKGVKCIEDNYSEHPTSTSRAILERDHNDVKKSDCILFNLLGTETVSIGTVMEIAWAKAYGVPAVLVIEPINIHQHCMLVESCGFTCDNLDAAIDIIAGITGTDELVRVYCESKVPKIDPDECISQPDQYKEDEAILGGIAKEHYQKVVNDAIKTNPLFNSSRKKKEDREITMHELLYLLSELPGSIFSQSDDIHK